MVDFSRITEGISLAGSRQKVWTQPRNRHGSNGLGIGYFPCQVTACDNRALNWSLDATSIVMFDLKVKMIPCTEFSIHNKLYSCCISLQCNIWQDNTYLHGDQGKLKWWNNPSLDNRNYVHGYTDIFHFSKLHLYVVCRQNNTMNIKQNYFCICWWKVSVGHDGYFCSLSYTLAYLTSQ